MTDVVYVTGPDVLDPGGEDELRWSLRSLYSHARNIGKIVVVGYVPGFLSDAVEKAVVENEPGDWGKHVHILNCLFAVINRGIVSDKFIYSSDDHFLRTDVDLDSYPVYFSGTRIPTIEQWVDSKYEINNWRKSCARTGETLRRHGYTDFVFHRHENTYIFPECANEVRAMVNNETSLGWTHGLEPTDMFMNVYATHHPDMKVVTKTDAKLNLGDFRSMQEVSDRIESLDMFSVDDELASSPEFKAYMNGTLTEKSPFEK